MATTGAGLGASHQTGWTGVIARAMHLFATSTAEQVRELGKAAAFPETQPARSGQTESAPQAARLEMREPLHPPPVGAVPTN